MNVRTLGVLAHVDAGKTTLCEQLLCRCGAIRQAGRVDYGNSFLDTDPLEKARGVTIYTGAARFSIQGNPFVLLDTPGHVDFMAEMERTLPALDAAVLVVSCVEGVQNHTETVFHCLQEQGIPTLFFLNKTDRVGADPQRVLDEIQTRLTPCAAFWEEDWVHGKLGEEAAALDESLLEAYLMEDFSPALWQKGLKSLFAAGQIFPCLTGSALQGEGIDLLLQMLAEWVPEPVPDAKALVRVIRIRREKSGARRTILRVVGEEITPRCLLGGEKTADLMQVHGDKLLPVQKATCGDLVAVSGLQQTRPGQLLSAETVLDNGPALHEPLMQSSLLYDDSLSFQAVWDNVCLLTDEDPQLHATLSTKIQPPVITLHVAGRLQLEVLQDVMEKRFSMPVHFGPCQVLYKETITAPVMGFGHFEPLRHYAEVHLRLSPGKPGSGIRFESEVSEDVLSRNWQRLIRTHVFERAYPGALIGAPVTDVQVTLTAGRAHEKHTEGGDFRQAVGRAIRQALGKAARDGQCQILEPWVRFCAVLEPTYTGRFLSDLTMMGGCMDETRGQGEKACLVGRAPFAALSDYGETLTHYTRGTGRLTFSFSGYEPCPNQQAVKEKHPYDCQADRENPADSVFCSHGAGFLVPWEEADSYMHLPLENV